MTSLAYRSTVYMLPYGPVAVRQVSCELSYIRILYLMYKCDGIQETGSTKHIAKLPEEDRATANM